MKREFEVFAGIIHGITAFGHVLGLVHAIRQKSKFDAIAHSAALVYDTWAVAKHARAAANYSTNGWPEDWP